MNKKNRIFLRGCHNLFNFGDDLLLISTLELLSKDLGLTNEDLDIYLSQNDQSLANLKFETNLKLKYCLELSDIIYQINLKLKKLYIPLEIPHIYDLLRNILTARVSKRLRISSFCLLIVLAAIVFTDVVLYKVFHKALFTKEYIAFLQKLDVIHYVGGGYFTDRWIEVLICEWFIVALAKAFNPDLKVIGTGLGLGPFKPKLNLKILKAFIKNFDYLFVREKESLDLINNLNIKLYKKVMGDDVILLLPYLNQLKSESKLNCSQTTALNLKSFPDHDYSLLKQNIEVYLKSIEGKKSRVEFFCFGRKPGPDDHSLVESLAQPYQDKLIIHDPYEEGWLKFLENLAKADRGLGFAYHFNVILTLLKIPNVNVYAGDYYRQKIGGVIKQLNKNSIILSIDELVGKDLASVLAVTGTNQTNTGAIAELMYHEMKSEYLSAYKRILNLV